MSYNSTIKQLAYLLRERFCTKGFPVQLESLINLFGLEVKILGGFGPEKRKLFRTVCLRNPDCRGHKYLTLNSSNSADENRWEISKALGHILLNHQHSWKPLVSDFEHKSQALLAEEEEAAAFARELVMPQNSMVRHLVETGWDIIELEEYFGLPLIEIKGALVAIGFMDFREPLPEKKSPKEKN